MPNIRDVSHEELQAILGYLKDRPEKDHPTVLVGGWAVYAYNPHEKSRDIDLVLSAKERGRLLRWLADERGYDAHTKQKHGWWGASKLVDPDAAIPQDKAIIVDVASYNEEYRFEGRDEQLNFDLVKDHHIGAEVDGLPAKIPSASLLILYKAKAVWDRTYRLSHGTSEDPGYDAGKVVKDKADILAILDSKPKEWDVEFLGTELSRLPFLAKLIGKISRDSNALGRYGRLDKHKANQLVKNLLALAEL